MVRADFLFSIVLVALGLATVAESLRMPTLSHLGVHPMSAPGLTPAVVGAVIAILGLALFLRSAAALAAARRGAEATGGTGRAAAIDWREWGRLALVLALCLVYAVGLIGRLPFLWATGIFVFAFVAVFDWNAGSRLRTLAGAAALAVASAFAVTFLFERVFLVRLP